MPTGEAALFVAVRVAAVTLAWIATYAVHSTALLGAAALIASRRSRATPELRDTLWKTALVGSLITATISTSASFDPLGGRYDAGRAVESREWKVTTAVASSALSSSASSYGARLPSSAARVRAIPLVLIMLWLTYALIVLTRVANATRRARAALGNRTELRDAPIVDALADVARRMGLRRAPRLTVTEHSASPVVLGAMEVCVPRRFLTEFNAEEQRGVLAHEVAHVVRHDPWWLLCAVTLESLFFFQPLNRLARSRLQEEAELLSDGLAARTGTSGIVLARSMARVAEWVSESRPGRGTLMAPALAEYNRMLVPRVQRLLGAAPVTRSRSAAGRHVALACALSIAAVALAPAFSAGELRAWGTPAFRWAGVVAAGNTIEIKGLMGDIRAEPTRDSVATVLATRHGRATIPDLQFEVVRHAGGVTICVVYPTPPRVAPNKCAPGRAGREVNTPVNDVEVEFLVLVPSGVAFAARVATGDVSTGVLDAPVTAHSASGNIDVSTTSYASGSSASGNISLRMGRTVWMDTLRVATSSGNIHLWLPAASDAHIQVESRMGTVRSEFPLQGIRRSLVSRLFRRGVSGENAAGTLGAGGRFLVAESTVGKIAIHRARD